MKRIIGLILAFTLVCSMTFVLPQKSHAAGNKNQGYKVLVQGKYLEQNKNTGYAQAVNGRVMVPYRALLNALGAEDKDISYDSKEKKVKATIGGQTISFAIGGSDIKIIDESGEEWDMETDSPAFADPTVNRTYVSARFISEAFDYEVGWDGATKTVVIVDINEMIPKLGDVDKDFSLMAKALNASNSVNRDRGIESNSNIEMSIVSKDDEGTASMIPIAGTRDDELNLKINGKIETKSKGVKSVGNLQLKTDVKKLFKGITAEDKAVLENYITAIENMNLEYKSNGEEGTVYVKSEILDAFAEIINEDDKPVKNQWFETSSDYISAFGPGMYSEFSYYSSMGEDLTATDFLEIMFDQIEDAPAMTFDEAKVLYEVFKNVMGDNNFKVTNEGGDKVYTISITEADILKELAKIPSTKKGVNINNIKKAINKIPVLSGTIKYTEDSAAKPVEMVCDIIIKEKQNKSNLGIKLDLKKDMINTHIQYKSKGEDMSVKISTVIKDYTGFINTTLPEGEKALDLNEYLAAGN